MLIDPSFNVIIRLYHMELRYLLPCIWPEMGTSKAKTTDILWYFPLELKLTLNVNYGKIQGPFIFSWSYLYGKYKANLNLSYPTFLAL